MQWWCSATTGPWTWQPIAYPGVWAFVLVLATLYWRLSRTGGTTRSTTRGATVTGWVGVVLVWLSLDWPMGPLAAGYLASAHAMQFLIVAIVAPPMLLIGVRNGLVSRLRPHATGLLPVLTHPLVCAVAFNIVIIATHVPRVNDALMPLQLGAFAVDAAWLVAGLWFWWPILVPVPERPRFVPPVKMLYLFLGTLVHTGIAMVMLVYDHPMYRTYELAPRATGMSALTDLKVAGGIMELVGAGFIFGVLTVMFFRWSGGSGAEKR